MRQLQVLVMCLSLAALSGGRRIELFRFNRAQTLPADDFIPVYSVMKDFPDKGTDDDVVLLKPIDITGKQAAYNPPSTEENEFVDTAKPEARNFQANPELRNFQTTPDLPNFQALPFVQTPELTNFQLPAHAAKGQLQPTANEAANSGRTFKHFLLLRSLLGSGGNGGGFGPGADNFGGGFIYPIIVNTPVNVTNMNNNNLTNVPAPAAAAAAGGGAGDDPNAGFRINYIGIPQTQQFPLQMPLQSLQMPTQQTYREPTPVYHQRQAVATAAQPTFAVAMLNIPGTTSFMPFSLPQQQQFTVHRDSNTQRRRHSQGWSSASKNQNSWSAFANNLRGVQFL